MTKDYGIPLSPSRIHFSALDMDYIHHMLKHSQTCESFLQDREEMNEPMPPNFEIYLSNFLDNQD